VSALAIAVGTVGVVLWIALCQLQLERAVFGAIGLEGFLDLGSRPAYNPLEQLAAKPVWAYVFLSIRFLGLAVIVPIIEEFFLRGFMMRIVVREHWWEVPFGELTPLAVVVGTAVPIWDCVAAHAVTNLLLGIYVVTQKQWQLW
jgi:hypothetical protein